MKYSDPIDQAAQLSEMYTDIAVNAQRQKCVPQQVQVQDEDGNWYWPVTECEDCGLDIEPGRLQMGRIRCLACQTTLESKEKQYAKW